MPNFMALTYYSGGPYTTIPREGVVPFPPTIFGSEDPRLFATSFTISEDCPLGSVNSLPCRAALDPPAKVVVNPEGFVSDFLGGFFLGGDGKKGVEIDINHHLFVTTRLSRQSAT